MPQRTTRERPLSAAALADLYGVSRVSVAKFCRSGKIPSFKIGTYYRISAEVAHGPEVRALLGDTSSFVQRMARQQVYFITADQGPIKIGRAVDVETRLRTIQTGYPYKLTIAATVIGGANVEYAYHQRFAERRLHGEWFERCSEILAEIERLNAIPAELPPQISLFDGQPDRTRTGRGKR